MHVYFMRHGQTNYNLLGLCNDDPEQDVHLTPAGIEQASQAALELKSEPLELIVTSELPRTRQTADIINQYHNVAIVSHSAVNDIRSGFEGLPVADYFNATKDDPLHISVNGGESLLMHKMRVLTYFDWLRKQSCNRILTIAHEETMRVFYSYFNSVPDNKLRELHFPNCKTIRFEL